MANAEIRPAMTMATEPMAEPLESISIHPSGAETAVVLLHGLGASGDDLAPLAQELGLPGVRFEFPHAPVRPVTINNGMRMRAWHDLTALGGGIEVGKDGVDESRAMVTAFLDGLVADGYAPERIVLAGFSQGGATALHAGLLYPQALAGIVSLSGYLPCADRMPEAQRGANASTPVFMGHGEFDPVVPIDYALRSQARLEDWGYDIDFRRYPAAHTIAAQEVVDLREWISARIA